MYIPARMHDSSDIPTANTHVSGVRQHGDTTGKTVLCLGVLEMKDGGH